MVTVSDILSDLVRVEQGWWKQNGEDVWRFVLLEDLLSKGIKRREGEGVASVRAKVITELLIDDTKENIELTYEMPQWMDEDGKMKPVLIHIRSDGDMDMFLAMRVNLHELKLYVVPLPKHMTLEVDDFSIVPVSHGFAYAEVVKGLGTKPTENDERTHSTSSNIRLTQQPKDQGESSKEKSIAWLGDAHHSRDVGALLAGLKRYKTACGKTPESRSLDILMGSEEGSENEGSSKDVTRNLCLSFAKAAPKSRDKLVEENDQPTETLPIVDLQITDLPAFVFADDAAPILDDVEAEGLRRTMNVVFDIAYEGDELFVGHVFKSKHDTHSQFRIQLRFL